MNIYIFQLIIGGGARWDRKTVDRVYEIFEVNGDDYHIGSICGISYGDLFIDITRYGINLDNAIEGALKLAKKTGLLVTEIRILPEGYKT